MRFSDWKGLTSGKPIRLSDSRVAQNGYEICNLPDVALVYQDSNNAVSNRTLMSVKDGKLDNGGQFLFWVS